VNCYKDNAIKKPHGWNGK